MSEFICDLSGSRGRSIDVYDNKCVITTDVTVGSVLTNNALDGQKTIFYMDVSGIQFKKSGFTLGYLQLETSSMQMNNQTSNMFSENTYTFEEGINGVNNDLIEAVHNYIVDRVEGYKYGTPFSNASLVVLVEKLYKYGHKVNNKIAMQADQEKKQIAAQEARVREEEERRKQEETLRKQEEAQQKAEAWKKMLEESRGSDWVIRFLEEAVACQRISEMKKLWEEFPKEENQLAEEIGKKISSAAQIERMYGSTERQREKLLGDIRAMIV